MTAFSTTLLLAEHSKGHGVLSCRRPAARSQPQVSLSVWTSAFSPPLLSAPPPLPVFIPTLRVDVHENKEKNLVSATIQLPGVNRENVSVDIHNNLLTVSGESKSESGSSTSWYLLRERHFGLFSRSFPVPEDVKVRGHGFFTLRIYPTLPIALCS